MNIKNIAQNIPRPKEMQLPKKKQGDIVLRLKPETHDKTMEELLALMMQKGIIATIDVVLELNNPY